MTHVTNHLTRNKPQPSRQQQADSVKRGTTFQGPPGGRVSRLALAVQLALC